MANIFSRLFNRTKEKAIVRADSSIRDRILQRGYNYESTDIYTALGYPTSLSYYDYKARYYRQDIAHRIVKSPVEQTWKDQPNVYESDDKETQFETAYDALVKDSDLYYWMYKLDLEANLGRYAVLFLGLDGEEDLMMPPEGNNELIYLSVFPEPRAEIKQSDTDPKSPRFGLPLIYQLQTDIDGTANITQNVHWSRVVHVALNTLESEIYGIPALEPIYNRLIGLEKLAGGSPEMYWRGARPGYAAKAMENSILTDEQLNDVKEQLSNFSNNMQRWLYTEGLDISALAPQVVSPKDHFDVQMKLIAAATRIPLRMLTGSERGELASVQDDRAWLSYIEERRYLVADHLILSPVIDRLIDLGVLPEPSDEYHIEWEELVVSSEKERADIGAIKIESLAKYVNAPGADLILPPEIFMAHILDMTEAEIELALNVADEDINEGEIESV